MPRILGVDIPNDKHVFFSLQYIYGIGPYLAGVLCQRTGVDPDKKARDLTEDELAKLASLLDNDFTVEGQLRRKIQQCITRLRDIGCYRGLRHRKGLPVRGHARAPTLEPGKVREKQLRARRVSRNCGKTFGVHRESGQCGEHQSKHATHGGRSRRFTASETTGSRAFFGLRQRIL